MIMAEKLQIQLFTLEDSNGRVAGETERGDRRTTSPEGSPGLQSEGREEILTITSSGGSAESIWSGDCLGQFVYNGEHKGAASYKQRDTIDTFTRYLYRLGDSTWAVGPELGGDKCYLRSSSTSSSVPSDNWQYGSNDKWKSDPGVRIVRGPLTSCQTISVEVRGAAATAQSDCAGDYRVTADWCLGHQVFKHSRRELYLCVGWWLVLGVRGGGWYITNRPGGDSAYIWSKATAWCPADRRAATRQGDTQSWSYLDSGKLRDGDIRVKCDVHEFEFCNGYNACNVM